LNLPASEPCAEENQIRLVYAYRSPAKRKNPNATADNVLDDGWWSGLIVG